jgi:Ca-activated chloride channel homolog
VEYFVRCANPWVLVVLFPLLAACVLIKVKWRRTPAYRSSLGSLLDKYAFVSSHQYKTIFFCMRVLALAVLAFLLSRPQLVDERSNIWVEGIDMMLVLDVSGSMDFRDYGDDKASRVDVAKEEAIRFIDKRVHDPLGLVIFGQEAVSRCPMTTDKNILKSIVQDLHIGSINPDGTMLSRALLTAANRLKNSHAKSKIIIVLTDGEPSPGDESPELAIAVAQRMGIKIYTIGIGSGEEKVFMHPLYGMIGKPGINKQLLSDIASKTGGKFFLAENQQEMRSIYDEIDRLEKTEYQTNVFSHYYELFMPFLWFVLIVMLLEVCLASWMWFSI